MRSYKTNNQWTKLTLKFFWESFGNRLEITISDHFWLFSLQGVSTIFREWSYSWCETGTRSPEWVIKQKLCKCGDYLRLCSHFWHINRPVKNVLINTHISAGHIPDLSQFIYVYISIPAPATATATACYYYFCWVGRSVCGSFRLFACSEWGWGWGLGDWGIGGFLLFLALSRLNDASFCHCCHCVNVFILFLFL